MISARDIEFRRIKPFRARPIGESCAFTADVSINRKRRDAIRDQAHASIDRAQLQGLLLIHRNATWRRQEQGIACRKDRLETDSAILGGGVGEDPTEQATSLLRFRNRS